VALLPRRGLAGPTRFARPVSLLLCAVALITASVPVLLQARPATPPDYPALYNNGITFADFLEFARAKRDEWRQRYKDASVTPDLITRMRALPSKRLILVVAEDWCSDSAQSIPYVARLVDGAPERLAMRIVNSTVGRPVMDANPTPDGRGATPTIVVLTEHQVVLGSWVERPSTAQAWFLEQQKSVMQQTLHDQLMKWYADDAGRTTLAEIAALLERPEP
jgi:hypothetical protein